MDEDKTWFTVEAIDGVHTLPNNDVLDHKLSVHCPCVPVVEEVGQTCWSHRRLTIRLLIIHEAMDGRPN